MPAEKTLGELKRSGYRPERVESQKIAKTGEPLFLRLIETDDVVATLAAEKAGRWVVGFALETDDVSNDSREFLDRNVTSVSDIDQLLFRVVLHQENASPG